MSTLGHFLSDYTVRNVLLGAVVLGVCSGVLGSFAVLRRQGLMGDALSHAALPGVCLAFMVTGSKAPLVLMAGAAVSGWLGMLLILKVLERTRIDRGSALGIVLTTFFGLGVVLLTVVQKGRDANQSGLDKFLFGQAAALVEENVWTMAVLTVLALGCVVLFYKEFKLFSFDPEFCQTLGFSRKTLANLVTGLLIVAVVIGLNTVGVVLMSAMLVAPGAAARQWTHSLSTMLLIAAGIGAGCGATGAAMSIVQGVPTGPAIVLSLAVVAFVSVVFGTQGGLLATRARRKGL